MKAKLRKLYAFVFSVLVRTLLHAILRLLSGIIRGGRASEDVWLVYFKVDKPSPICPLLFLS